MKSTSGDEFARRVVGLSGTAKGAPITQWIGRRRSALVSVTTVLVLLGAWSLVTEARVVTATQLPSPQVMVATLVAFFTKGYQGTPWYVEVGLSVMRVSVGFIAGSAAGTVTGLAIGISPTTAAVFRPILAFMRPIPMIAFVPVVILFFGLGEFSKILLIFASVYFYMALYTAAGVASIPREVLLAGSNVGYSGLAFYWHIVVPASMPAIMNGLRLSAAVAWLLVVAAEMVAAQAGLGFMILDASTFFRIPFVYLGVLLIGSIGLGIDVAMGQVQRRVVHWEGQ